VVDIVAVAVAVPVRAIAGKQVVRKRVALDMPPAQNTPPTAAESKSATFAMFGTTVGVK
jgi:hypothetical protein